ncbi:MAG: ACP S-malonyltransferase [Proteobacteria bacterium]|nr:ACP S-malonyltransferase [Pseudomonadota bacterium]
MTRAFLFPGQGSQSTGMGKALSEAFTCAREVFQEVDEALGQKLSALMFNGPEETLKLTANAQPALMAVSIAVMRVLSSEGGKALPALASHVAGHSLGEYTALCAAGSFSLSDTARLLRLRGASMQAAVPVGVGAMAALLGVDLDVAREIAEAAAEKEVCACANDNAPGQVVISGHKAAVERALKIAADKGFKRSIMLQVSAPFHCALMEPAAKVMKQALEKTHIAAPVVPLIANVTAEEVVEPTAIRRLLVEQVTGLVRWRESMLALKAKGVEKAVEAGSGTVLAGLMKRIDKDIQMTSIHTPQEIEAFLQSV